MSSSSSSVFSSSTQSTPSSTLSFFSTFAPTGGPTDGNNGETRVLDDTDLSIVYWPGPAQWSTASDTNAYNQTIHQTSCNTCTALLLFNGTGISLTSVISPSGANFMAVLDGVVAGPFQLYSPIESTTVVYAIEGLPFAQHNITFIKRSDDANDQTLFNIDSLTVISRVAVSATGSASSVSPTPSGRSTVLQTETGSTPTNSAIPSAQASSPAPIGAIIGGTVGGILVIGVLAAWWILVRRRKSKAQANATKRAPATGRPASAPRRY